ncbi:uncharacterized protein TOT_040000808 [Theileria orientalis strain Shintoku]|uniref:Methylase n=1 Tax=Theileria orientalis strain Shintoku TaxID=869250 RepID=J7MH06_THEOR|nr:uncharacterized protein TOT_040000808 [Theileria orientalis strain Shintoku]BAM42441.1 uncharacterized protein TOT_040000808 [Theileria orientalis strain Shintoku]|eukprot:XP_009692742.1 uncharacterized protein TOT_040000808 [Theileria orientalis strain Shintoku]
MYLNKPYKSDDSEFFTHTLHDTGDGFNKQNKAKHESKPVKRIFKYDEKLIIDRSISKNIKTRYKLQQFPKKQGVTRDGSYKFCSNLRICGGSIRGRKLCIPPVYVRPVMSRVKISVFNFLRSLSLFSIDKTTNVIDLYCGTGSLGLESLSYGSHKCTFVDISLKCLKAVNLNTIKCGFQDKCRIIRSDSIELINSPYLYNINEKFDLMFVAPPYEEVIYSDLLQYISECKILNDNAIVVVEYPKELSFLPHVINDKLFGVKNKKYGRTVIAMYLFNPSENRRHLVERGRRSFVPRTGSSKKLRTGRSVNGDVLVY